MVKQKHKNKNTPFAKMLSPGEEIVGVCRFRTDKDLEKWYSHRYLVLTVFLAAPLICSYLVASAVPTGNQSVPTSYQVEVFLQILGFCAPFMVLALLAFIGDFLLWHNVQYYAVTNQRVLFRSRLRSRSLYLTEIKDIFVQEGNVYTHITYQFRRWISQSTQSGWEDDTWTWRYPNEEDTEGFLDAVYSLREFPITVGHKPVPVPSGKSL